MDNGILNHIVGHVSNMTIQLLRPSRKIPIIGDRYVTHNFGLLGAQALRVPGELGELPGQGSYKTIKLTNYPTIQPHNYSITSNSACSSAFESAPTQASKAAASCTQAPRDVLQ